MSDTYKQHYDMVKKITLLIQENAKEMSLPITTLVLLDTAFLFCEAAGMNSEVASATLHKLIDARPKEMSLHTNLRKE